MIRCLFALTVVLGLAVAVAVFGVTFFFTCLGIYSIGSLDNAAGAVIVWGVAILTAVGAFFFTLWGMLKVIRAFKK